MEELHKFSFEPVCDIYTEEIRKNSTASKQSNAEVIVYPSQCILTKIFKEKFQEIRNFKVYPDDTWIVTFPKSGTTWTQEMVWLLKNNFDFETAKSVELRYRCPFLDLETIINLNHDLEELPKTIQDSVNLKRPRCIKSHLPIELLPKEIWTVKPKIVYVSRDPRDVALSYFHHHRLWNGYKGTLENFINVFLADRVMYAPYWNHNLGFWNLKDKSHVLVNSFEDMKKDLEQVIRKTAKFLGVNVNDKQVLNLKQHLSFNNMKQNQSVNANDLAIEIKKQIKVDDESLVFIRKGETGEGAKTFTPEILEKFEKWTKINLVDTTYSDYPFSIK